jgi:hypothetical protein
MLFPAIRPAMTAWECEVNRPDQVTGRERICPAAERAFSRAYQASTFGLLLTSIDMFRTR